MNTRRMPRSLVLAVGAAASLLAYGAHGQESDPNVPVTARPRPDFDPLGVRAGGFLIYPSVTVDGTYITTFSPPTMTKKTITSLPSDLRLRSVPTFRATASA